MTSMSVIVSVLAVLGIAAESSLAQGRGGGGGGGGHSQGGARPPGGAHAPGGGYHYGRYGYGYGGYRPGGRYPYYPYWGGWGLGIGLGWAGAYYGGWPGYGYGYGNYYGNNYAPLAATQYTVPTNSGWTVSTAPSAEPASAPELIFYPRNGQSDEKKEADLRECNRWATTQPAAMADANIFMRAALACMDGRGYTGR